MSEFKTSKKRPVKHRHSEVTFSPELIEQARQWMRRNHPNAVEIRKASCEYNCHGYTFARRHAWFIDPARFIADDFVRVRMSEPRVGDVLIYMMGDEIAHSAVVTEVNDDGEITEVRSKWGAQSEVFHHPLCVDDDYGRPSSLYRQRTDFVPLDTMTGEAIMRDEAATREFIGQAMERFSDPDVYLRVMLASTPEVARRIIENLPGVRELIDVGPDAGKAALDFLEREETQQNFLLTNIMLYLLQRIPTKEAVQPLAKLVRLAPVSCFDQDLAAEAFLAAAEIEIENEDPVSFAFREAEKFL